MTWGSEERNVREPLTAARCMTMLAGGRVARLAFDEDEGPVIERVPYRVVDELVYLRCGPGRVLEAARRNARVALEVGEELTEEARSWSVMLRGRLAVVTDAVELATLTGTWFWPRIDTEASSYLRLSVTSVSGHLIRHEPMGAVVTLPRPAAPSSPHRRPLLPPD